jgi:chemotaxis protein methyltransferase CheR
MAGAVISATEEIDRMVLGQIRDLIAARTGIWLKEDREVFLRGLVQGRAAARTCRNLREYADLLGREADEDGEIGILLEEITIHETSFFRYSEQFGALRELALPEILSALKARGTRGLRIWSVGCATGQEPYSIAMTLFRAIPFFENWQCEIIATDISRRALAVAQKGVYRKREMDGIDPTFIDRFFTEEKPGYLTIRPEVARLVKFYPHNLATEPSFTGLDIIFCRNVLIYFDRAATRRAVRGFHGSLRERGFLFLGHSESIADHLDLFEPCYGKGALVLRKRPSSGEMSAGEQIDERKQG